MSASWEEYENTPWTVIQWDIRFAKAEAAARAKIEAEARRRGER